MEAARRDIPEPLFGIEGDGAAIVVLYAEQQTLMPPRTGFGRIEQVTRDAAAVEPRQQVDLLQLDIAVARGIEFGPVEQGVADRGIVDFRQPGPRACLNEPGEIGRRVLRFAMRDQRIARNHSGEGFEEGGVGDQ